MTTPESPPETAYVFDWQGTSDEFIRWLVAHLMVDERVSQLGDQDLVETLSERTDSFTNVVLTMQINGVEVNVEHFVRSLQGNLNVWAQDAARELVERCVPDLRDELQRLRDALRHLVEVRAHKLGLKLDLNDPDD